MADGKFIRVFFDGALVSVSSAFPAETTMSQKSPFMQSR